MEGTVPTIIAWDLNAKNPTWGSGVINPAGQELYDDADTNSYDVLGSEEAIHVPTDSWRRSDVLDIVLSRNVNCPIVVEVLYNLNSQHLPILITLGLKAMTSLLRAFNNKIDWRLYQQYLHERPLAYEKINSTDDVEAAATRII